MNKRITEIYNQVEETLTSYEIKNLIDNLEILRESKEEWEMYAMCATPSEQVDRENFKPL